MYLYIINQYNMVKQEPPTNLFTLIEDVYTADEKQNKKDVTTALNKLYKSEYYLRNKERINAHNAAWQKERLEKNRDNPEFQAKMKQYVANRVEKVRTTPELREKHVLEMREYRRRKKEAANNATQ